MLRQNQSCTQMRDDSWQLPPAAFPVRSARFPEGNVSLRNPVLGMRPTWPVNGYGLQADGKNVNLTMLLLLIIKSYLGKISASRHGVKNPVFFIVNVVYPTADHYLLGQPVICP